MEENVCKSYIDKALLFKIYKIMQLDRKKISLKMVRGPE